jgi:hypothetical protein
MALPDRLKTLYRPRTTELPTNRKVQRRLATAVMGSVFLASACAPLTGSGEISLDSFLNRPGKYYGETIKVGPERLGDLTPTKVTDTLNGKRYAGYQLGGAPPYVVALILDQDQEKLSKRLTTGTVDVKGIYTYDSHLGYDVFEVSKIIYSS